MKRQSLEGAISKNIGFVSKSTMDGRADGAQVMVDRGFAYIGHLFSHGVSVLDVKDPKNPKPIAFLPSMENCWSPHLQTSGDLLLVANSYDFFANPKFADERTYYTQSVEQ